MPDATLRQAQDSDSNLAAKIHHSSGSYPVVAGRDILYDIGERLADAGVRGVPISSPTTT